MNKTKAMLMYYLFLSLVFFGGRLYIVETHHMQTGPVAMEAFHRLFSWVHLFAYLYIVPLAVAGFWLLHRYAGRRSFSPVWRAVLYTLYLVLAAAVGYFLLFLFVLLFYGFAP